MHDDVTAYPLPWPTQWPRSARRDLARFRTPLAAAHAGLLDELHRLGATDVVVSSNAEPSRRGGYLAMRREPDDPGVAVYFRWGDRQFVIPCDCWTTVAANLQAVRLTVAAIRGIARWGTPGLVAAAFSGFAALPAQSSGEGAAWWQVLGVRPDATDDEIEAAYRRLARRLHPDAGGSHEAFLRLAAAYQQAREKR